MNKFIFELGQTVELASGEAGEIIARGEYLHAENTYRLRYKAVDGRMVESWWDESALQLKSAT